MRIIAILSCLALAACNGSFARGVSQGLNGYTPAPTNCQTYQVGYIWKTTCY